MLPFIGPEMVAALLHRCDESGESIENVQSNKQTRPNGVIAASWRKRCKGIFLIFNRRVRIVLRSARFIPPTLRIFNRRGN
jgi:hypothetical protein